MSDILAKLKQRFSYVKERQSLDLPALNIPVKEHKNFFKALRDEFDYDMLTDVTAVDWDKKSPRFTVVYHLYSTKQRSYIRIACDCENDETPVMESLVSLWPAANWHEREAYDMFGIRFNQHPDLRRILMWDGYPYYPLRKEFPLAGIETELPAADIAEVTDAKVIPAPMMGGPFTASHSKCMSKSEPRAADQSWTEEHVKPS